MSDVITKRKGKQCVTVTLAELIQLATHAKQLKMSAKRVRSAQSGQHLSRLLGKGMDFAESRRYQIGDDIRCIDWRITARTGKTHTKLFTEEKERQVLLWIDMRSSMFFATQGVFKSVQAALMASYIGWNAALKGNRLGGFIFDDVNQHEFRPTLGRKSVLPLLQKLSEYERHLTKPDKLTATKNMDEAILSIQRVVSPGSLIFLISDFRHLSSNSRDILMQIARHSNLCLCFLHDTFEARLPKKSNYSVTDGQDEVKLNLNQLPMMQKYQELFLERKNQINSLSTHQHIHVIEVSTEDDCYEVLRTNFR